VPARATVAWLAAAGLTVLLGAGPARAEFYRWVDAQGVVHLTDAPTDPRFHKYTPSPSGSGKGINLIPGRLSLLGLGKAQPVYSPGVLPADGGDASGYDPLIERSARRFQVPAALIKAVVKAESNFQRYAVSSKGAQGLMQLMPATAADLGLDDPFSAEDNVLAGTRYLREMMDRYGDWKHALAAYNAGPAAVDQYGGVPPFPETQEYVRRVLEYYRRYHGDPSR
jgi:hypothetical protein